jgi:hypothetical protein
MSQDESSKPATQAAPINPVPLPPEPTDPMLLVLTRIALAVEGIRDLVARPPGIPTGEESPLAPLLGDASSIAQSSVLSTGLRKPLARD